jgi:hypothetical protein
MAVAAAWGRKAEEDIVTTAEMLEKKGEERGLKQGIKEGLHLGEAKGKAESVLTVLGARDVPVSDELRERILSCQDLAVLDRWIARATTAKSVAEVVGE